MKTLTNMWNPAKERAVPGQTLKKSFPGNTEEARQFQLDITKAIYSPQQLPKMLQMLEVGAKQGKLPGVVGHVASSIIVTLLQRRSSETGRKVHIKLLFFGLRNAIMAIAEIAEKAGIAKMSPQDIQQAIEIAGKSADSMINSRPKRRPNQPQRPGQPMQPQGRPMQPQQQARPMPPQQVQGQPMRRPQGPPMRQQQGPMPQQPMPQQPVQVQQRQPQVGQRLM